MTPPPTPSRPAKKPDISPSGMAAATLPVREGLNWARNEVHDLFSSEQKWKKEFNHLKKGVKRKEDTHSVLYVAAAAATT
jgi:hypothetical protein